MFPKINSKIMHSCTDSQEMTPKQQTVSSLQGHQPCVIFSNKGDSFRVIFSTVRVPVRVTFSSLQPDLIFVSLRSSGLIRFPETVTSRFQPGTCRTSPICSYWSCSHPGMSSSRRTISVKSILHFPSEIPTGTSASKPYRKTSGSSPKSQTMTFRLS